MDDLTELERSIRERLATAEARRQSDRETVRCEMIEQERRAQQFEVVARRLMDAVIRPRLAKLTNLFPNGHLLENESDNVHRCACSFVRTPEFPATTKLEIGITPGTGMTSAVVNYALEILPVFLQFDGHDRLEVPLDAVDEGEVASWINSKLLAFTDTYLKLQLIDQYQQENLVVDPVCGMRINRANAAAATEFEGKAYYFCVEDCRKKFVEDPRRYVALRR